MGWFTYALRGFLPANPEPVGRLPHMAEKDLITIQRVQQFRIGGHEAAERFCSIALE